MRIFSSVCCRLFLVPGAFCFALLLVLIPVHARAQAGQTIDVANGDVTGLITAIQTLNANGGGTIDLASGGTYSVTAPSDWWYGPNAFPAIASPITINGNGATISRASGSPKFRFFYISGGFSTLPVGALTLNEVTLSGGLAQGGNGAGGNTGGGGGAGLGGAIYNQGTLLLTDVTLTLNTALGGSGGSFVNDTSNNGGGGGLGGDGDGSGGGGGFKTEGGGGAGGSFQGTEGGASCSTGGTSNFGGNGGAGIGTGGSGGGFEPGQNGAAQDGPPGLGGGGGYMADGYAASGCAGGGGAFGGGGGGDNGVPGNGGVGGGGGGTGGFVGFIEGSGGFGGGSGGYGYANLPVLPGGPQESTRAARAIVAQTSSLYVECYRAYDNPGGGGCGTGGFGGGGGGVQLGEDQIELTDDYTNYGGFGGGTGGNSANVDQGANSGGGGGAGMGGAIFNHGGFAWISSSTFTSNAAQGGAPAGTAGTSDGFGGAIFNLDGLVQLNNASYSGDTATNSAAGGDQGPFIYNMSANMGVTGPNQSPSAYLFLNSTPLASNSDVQNNDVNGPSVVSSTATVTAVNIVFSSGGTLSSIQPTTQGLANQDYTLAGNGSCIIGITFSASDSCTAFLWVAPLSAGIRPGSVVLTDASGNVLGVAYIAATGHYPQITYSSTSSQGVGSGWNFTSGIAVDASGSVYVADYGNNNVVKVPFSNGSFGTPVTLASGGNPNAVAVDGAGNVFYTNFSSAMEVPFNGTSYGAAISISDQLSPGWNYPTGIAVDGAGDLFVLDGNDQVVEVPRTATGFGAGVAIGQNDFINPVSVAVDGAENIYVADSGYINISGYAAVYQFPYSGGSWGGPNSIGSGYTEYLSNVAVDATGDLYVSDEGAGTVVRFPWTGTGLGNPATMLSGQWNAVAVDNLGNLYGAASTPQVTKFTVSSPPTFTFATPTTIGSLDTADGPQTVSLFNIGNEPLVFTTPTTGSNPSYPAGFPANSADGSLCTSGASVPEAGSCDISVNFVPTGSGTNTGSVVLTDNAANATQSIQLIGIGIGTQTITFTPPASPVYYGIAPITLVATGGASGNPVTFSIVSGPGTLSGTNNSVLTVTGPGTIVIAANQASSADYTAAPQVTQSITVLSAVLAAIGTPAPGSVLSGASVTFSWTAGTGVTAYFLSVGTTGVGSRNIYNGSATEALSAGVTGLPVNGETVYARLGSKVNGVWQTADYTFIAAATPAAITSPTPGTALSGADVTFDWNAGSGVTAYFLSVGTSGVGSKNIYAGAATTALSAAVTGLPLNGATVYARLGSKINGVWQTADYTYIAAATPAALTTPTPGTALTSSSVTFSWTAGVGVTEYFFQLGTKGVGSSNLYNPGATLATSASVTGLPVNGETINARLGSKINGVWQTTDYTYIAAATPAALATPTPGSVLTGAGVTFTWTAGAGVSEYFFQLGTKGVGSSNLYNPGATTATSAAVTGLPVNGETIYARLGSKINGAWQTADYTYIAAATPAALTTPTPGTTLAGASVTFTWTAGAGVSEYFFQLGTKGVGSSDLYNPGATLATSASVTGLPVNGETIYARLASKINGVWQTTDYTYTAQ